jgi:hypothetical protein
MVAKSLSFPLTDPRQFDIVQFGSARLAGAKGVSFVSKRREFVTPGGTETADDVDLG